MHFFHFLFLIDEKRLIARIVERKLSLNVVPDVTEANKTLEETLLPSLNDGCRDIRYMNEDPDFLTPMSFD
jgi:hypothetical protein